MIVGIVDSGIDLKHERLKGAVCSEPMMQIDSDGKVLPCIEHFDEIGHGTACAGIIWMHAPHVIFKVVKIFNRKLVATQSQLSSAIEWCLDNDVKVINLSLGMPTSEPSDTIREICLKARSRQVIIVAAANNDLNVESYPAYFPEVFGVCAGYVPNKKSHGHLPGSPIQFIAKGTLQRVIWRNSEYRVSAGSSFACSHMTGIITQLMTNSNLSNVDEIAERLVERADQRAKPLHDLRSAVTTTLPHVGPERTSVVIKRLFYNYLRTIKLGRIGLFPLSEKESRTIFSLREYCKCPITECIDYPFSTNRARDKGNSELVQTKRNMSEVNLEAVDTLLTGYFKSNIFEGNIKFGESLLKEALRRNLNLLIFDKTILNDVDNARETQSYHGDVNFPGIDENTFELTTSLRFLPKVRIPVLAVVGTGNKQGKFTTQVIIRSILEKHGYAVQHLATEPYGILLGATFSFPYGYMSTVSLAREQWGDFLTNICKGMQQFQETEIILTGTQGMTIPLRHSATTSRTNEMSTLEFLCGVRPDAIICTIYGNDDVDTIRDVSEAVRIICNAPTILFAMTPWERVVKSDGKRRLLDREVLLSPAEKKERLSALEEKLGKPVVDVMDPTSEAVIAKAILDYFS